MNINIENKNIKIKKIDYNKKKKEKGCCLLGGKQIYIGKINKKLILIIIGD